MVQGHPLFYQLFVRQIYGHHQKCKADLRFTNYWSDRYMVITNGLRQGCPTRGPRAAMRPAWCLGAAHYSFSLQVVFFTKIVTISSKRVERA